MTPVPPASPSPAPVPPPAPLKRRPPPPPPAPSEEPARPPSTVSSPVFTLETREGSAEVFINGKLAGSTPHRWSVTPDTVFDPNIPVIEWPPAFGRPAAQGRVLGDGGQWSSMEVWIADGQLAGDALEEFRKRFPQLAPGEHVLFVRAELPGHRLQGALRVRVPGRRAVSYMPTEITRESPDFQRWSRAIWFDRE